MDFRDFVDLAGNELRNFRVQALSADPANTTARLYYNTTANELRYFNGTTWISLTTGSGYTAENARDDIAAAFAAGANTVVTVTPNDGADSITLGIGAGQVLLSMLAAGVRLDTINAPTAPVSLNSQRITNLADPTTGTDATNKQYVDAAINGLDWKANARAATTANIANLATGAPNTLDGVTLAANDRILVKDQTTGSQNGIYVVTTLGTGANGVWTRATDADASAEVTSGMSVAVTEGTANGDTVWILITNDPIVLATTALVFTQLPTPNSLTVSGLILRTGQVLSLDHTSTTHVTRTITGSTTGGATSEVLTHNFNTRRVKVEVSDQNTPWGSIGFTVEKTSVNTVTIRSGANIAAGLEWAIFG